jgi:DNA polymerase-1
MPHSSNRAVDYDELCQRCPGLAVYSAIWVPDFEFRSHGGDPPVPVSFAATDLRSGRRIFLDESELARAPQVPFDVGSDVLYVAYAAGAEIGCHEVLRWETPQNILDLHVEFRHRTNGRRVAGQGTSLLAALAYFGLPAMDDAHKAAMRELILRGGYSERERALIHDYNWEDVVATTALLFAMASDVDLPRALLRGRFSAACAKMEHAGIPVDVATHALLRENRSALVDELTQGCEGVFVGTLFDADAWGETMRRERIAWPRLASGKPALNKDVFASLADQHPTIRKVGEVRALLAKLRQSGLQIGGDGRARAALLPFGTITGRNTPRGGEFIFAYPKWFRALVRPEPGRALVYLDYRQQEWGIAAALSEDANMMRAYRMGDPYPGFAHLAGAVPSGATKKSHPRERDLFKQCALAVMYGMGVDGLAAKIGRRKSEAQALLDLHRRTFPRLWDWLEAVIMQALSTRRLESRFGWSCWFDPREPKPRTIRNYLVQANGAEMLRVAVLLAQQSGVRVLAPVHDALLIEADEREVLSVAAAAVSAMESASLAVHRNLRIEVEAKIVGYPDRLIEPEYQSTWLRVASALGVEDATSGVGA